MNKAVVAVLRGGPDDEHHVSMETGSSVLSALVVSPYASRDVIITKAGEWVVDGFVKRPDQALAGIDVTFNALHGHYGEGGGVQRVLQQVGVPYTGSGIYPAAASINKALAKQYAKKAGFLTPEFFRVRRESVNDPYLLATQIAKLFGPDYVIKPTLSGSSRGLFFASSVADLAFGLSELLMEYEDILVEERIYGREIASASLERYRNQAFYHLPLTQVKRPDVVGVALNPDDFVKASQYVCPAQLARDEQSMVYEATKQIHTALGLRQYSLTDFILSDKGLYFLEINSQPGLTPRSIFPQAADAIGGSFVSLVEHLVADSFTKRY